MKRTRLVILLMIGIFFLSVTTIAEEITLTTYYPAPYGEYQQLYVSGNVGIGTTGPGAKLEVRAVGAGQIVASDAAGNAVGFYASGTGGMVTSVGGTVPLHLAVNYSSPKVTVATSGNVGIGTTGPTARLHVNGNIKAILNDIDGGSPANMRYNSGTNEIGYDVAELFEANEEVEPGDVLSIDEEGNLKKSVEAYDIKVAGIVSEAPAILFEGSQLQIAPQPFTFQRGKKPPLALAGRVLCKVTTRGGGPIKRGDLLVTSSKAGYAMRARPENVRIGTVLGKALEPLDSGDGKIIVLVTLQ